MFLPKKREVSLRALPALKASKGIIQALQLSVWDNTFGPRVHTVWSLITSEAPPESTRTYISRHTLDGDVSRTATPGSSESRFSVFSSLGLACSSISFSAPDNGELSKYSLSILVEKESISRYHTLHEFTADTASIYLGRLTRLLALRSEEEAMKVFSEQMLPALITNLNALYHASLPSVLLENTHFSTHMDPLDQSFLARVLTSSLTTQGNTVVVGDEAKLVNLWISTLSVFLTTDEKKRSAYLGSESCYVPNLFLQGLCSGELAADEILQSRFPTTVVDITKRSVSQTAPFHKYALLRKDWLTHNIEVLDGKSRTWTPTEPLFSVVKDHAPSALAIVAEVFAIPQSLREGYLVQSMRLYQRRAVTLIRYVVALRARGGGQGRLNKAWVKTMKADLDLGNVAEFNAVLGAAEKLNPGIWRTVKGDLEAMEVRVVEALTNF